MFEVISGKLHGLKVTRCELNYHGSVTIDLDFLEAAEIPLGVFVYIWNKNSGSRLSTYTLPGKRGSREVCLNGAAARLCQPGDEVIISLSEHLPKNEIRDRIAKIVTFEHEVQWNTINEELSYIWDTKGDFKIVPKNGMFEQAQQTLHSPSLCKLPS